MKKSIVILVLFPFFTTSSDVSLNQPIASYASKGFGATFCNFAQPKLARKRAHIKGYKLSERQKRMKSAFNTTIGIMMGIGVGLGLILFGIGFLLLKAGL